MSRFLGKMYRTNYTINIICNNDESLVYSRPSLYTKSDKIKIILDETPNLESINLPFNQGQIIKCFAYLDSYQNYDPVNRNFNLEYMIDVTLVAQYLDVDLHQNVAIGFQNELLKINYQGKLLRKYTLYIKEIINKIYSEEKLQEVFSENYNINSLSSNWIGPWIDPILNYVIKYNNENNIDYIIKIENSLLVNNSVNWNNLVFILQNHTNIINYINDKINK